MPGPQPTIDPPIPPHPTQPPVVKKNDLLKTDQLLAAREKAKLVRKWCMVSTTEAASGHPTSCLSAADITTVLFNTYFHYDLSNPHNPFNDCFVLSKGHASPLLYTLFGVAGAYPLEELKTLRKFGSRFEGHPTPKFVYTEAATGSLGQGLSVGAGTALISKREGLQAKSFVLTGDGELAEGQIWEAANFAAFHELDNLILIADINRLAQSGETMFGHQVDQYVRRFKAFGFEVMQIDGHNYEEIDIALDAAVNNTGGKPFAIIAKTIKGKGVSFLENKDGWHGKALKKEELEKALEELGDIYDSLRFDLPLPKKSSAVKNQENHSSAKIFSVDATKEYASREVFGEVLTQLGADNKNIYVLDGDVKNSTFTEDFLKVYPDRFVESYIAEQNMVSVAAGLSRMGKIPVVATFAAFLTRAADQIRMARVSEANIKFVGSHVGVSIGEDGPSQMGLEDISMFGTIPGTVVIQPCDAISTARLVPLMMDTKGFAYMRTLRSKTAVIHNENENFSIGGSTVLRESAQDVLTVIASGITVPEALKALDELKKDNIYIRVVDCYSISPIDKQQLIISAETTRQPVLITVEDHFAHGGLGDFVLDAVAGKNIIVEKLAVEEISSSGEKDTLMKAAGIDAAAIVKKVHSLMKK